MEIRALTTPAATSYLIVMEDRSAFIIDAPGPELMGNLITLVKVDKINVQGVLLTHGHYDHILGLGEVREAFPSLPIYLEREDFPFINDGALPNRAIFGRGCPYDFDSLPHDITPLKDQIGPFRVIRAPGHTPGSVIYYSSENRVAFTGDTIFSHSVGRTDLPLGSYIDLLTSLERAKNEISDDTTLFPGHGSITTMLEEKRANPYLN